MFERNESTYNTEKNEIVNSLQESFLTHKNERQISDSDRINCNNGRFELSEDGSIYMVNECPLIQIL